MAKSKYQIPFDKDEQLVSYPDYTVTEWKDNFVFPAILKYNGYSRGMSSAQIKFLSGESKKKYNMFMTDFDKVAPLMINGIVSGNFTFCKRGMNYGLKLAGEN